MHTVNDHQLVKVPSLILLFGFPQIILEKKPNESIKQMPGKDEAKTLPSILGKDRNGTAVRSQYAITLGNVQTLSNNVLLQLSLQAKPQHILAR